MTPVYRSDPFLGPTPGSFEAWLSTVFVGEDPGIRQARGLVLKAARADLPVLVTGETGTGKDIVARAAHRGSARGTRRMFVVPLGGAGDTAWSVLFGHKRGSFTGSVGDHEGIFSAAHRSSLLLDDVDTAPEALQPMLLRAVETGFYRPLGALHEKRSDVRILATSNANLKAAISSGRFRADLYERLSVLRISLPPLRDRRADLKLLVPHFLAKAEAMGYGARRVSPEGFELLRDYPWPGNVRELEHVLYRAAVEGTAPVIGAQAIRDVLGEGAGSEGPPGRRSAGVQVGRLQLEEALERARGNKRAAARLLGICPDLLYKLIRRYGIVTSKESPILGRQNP